jgi:hypothetical protein
VTLVLLAGTAWSVAAMAHDAGAFGCTYRDRGRPATWRLAAESPQLLRVRIGEGVLLASPEPGGLRDVQEIGTAGLAPGTQNGIRDYVYAVTAHGIAVVTARAADGQLVTATLLVTC